MYHGAPPLTTKDEIPSGFEYLMLKTLEGYARKYKVYLCLDAPDAKKRRQKVNAQYKENREALETDMFPRLGNLLPAIESKFTFVRGDKAEADDVIYVLTKRLPFADFSKIVILSNDKDLFHCINDKVSQETVGRGRSKVYGPTDVLERFRVHPHQWLYYRAFTGDASDSLTGVPRIQKALVAEACRQCVKPPLTEKPFEYLGRVYDYLSRKVSNSMYPKLLKVWEARQIHSNLEVMAPYINEPVFKEPTGDVSEWEHIVETFELDSLKEETEF